MNKESFVWTIYTESWGLSHAVEQERQYESLNSVFWGHSM